MKAKKVKIDMPILFTELAEEMNKSGDIKSIILNFHLRIEFVLTQMLFLKLPRPEKIIDNRTSFMEKLNLCSALDLIYDDLFNCIKSINSIRNEFFHEIQPDLTKIEKHILSIDVNKIQNREGKNFKKTAPYLDLGLKHSDIITRFFLVLGDLYGEYYSLDVYTNKK